MANSYADATPYKQFQLKGTATRIAGDLFFFQEQGNIGYVEGLVGCLPVYATQGQTIIPYILTDVSGKLWNITLTGVLLK